MLQYRSINPNISPIDALVVPDKNEKDKFGLDVIPNTIAALAVRNAAQMARDGDEGNPAGRLLGLQIQSLDTEILNAQRENRLPTPVHFDAEETELIMRGLERLATDGEHPYPPESSIRAERAEQALGTHHIIEEQARVQGYVLPPPSDTPPAPQE